MSSKKDFVIGIDASNIRHGGGITHLSQLLEHAQPNISGIKEVIVWASQETLNLLPEREWLKKNSHKLLDGNFFTRTFWQIFKLDQELKNTKSDLLFVPGASFMVSFKPVISMHQNLLPFEWQELLRYGFSIYTIKWVLLRITQSFSFKKSDGIIFLSEYSKKVLNKVLDTKNIKNRIIPHGVEERFSHYPKKQMPIKEYSVKEPFKIAYISTVDFYKHQWNVAEAVISLREEGYPVELAFYGSSNDRALKKLNKIIIKSRSEKKGLDKAYIQYFNEIAFKEIEDVYFDADMSVFASSCETFGQIIVESMAAGLPIASSNKACMPEILGEAAVYFDPLNIEEIKLCIKALLDSENKRFSIAIKAHERSKKYTWEKTSMQTFNFFKDSIKENLLIVK